MATLTRRRESPGDAVFRVDNDITLGIPTPFPTRTRINDSKNQEAEEDSEGLLDTLEDEELQLDDVVSPAPPSFLQQDPHGVVAEPQEQPSEDLLPSIGQVQITCISALQDILRLESRPGLDRRHSMPASSYTIEHTRSASGLRGLVTSLRAQANQGQMVEATTTSTQIELLQELRTRVDRLVPELSPQDAELARTLVSLLAHFHQLTPPKHPRVLAQIQSTLPRAASWTTTPPTSESDPYTTLRRQVSDFQLERSTSSLQEGSSVRVTAVLPTGATNLWSQIDAELETVLTLCRSRAASEGQKASEDPFADPPNEHPSLPPEYDAADYDYAHEIDSLPEYEPREGFEHYSKPGSSYKGGAPLEASPSRLNGSANEKMRLDFEAVTSAIDRLYLVAPQLHNQRVELNKEKLEAMERAKRKGKHRQRDSEMEAARELDRMLELIGKASERKMANQSVSVDDSFRIKMERARLKDQEKRAEFVDHLASHSDAGRLHSQDASFLGTTSRSRSHPSLADAMLDPDALLTLPEFIREGMPNTAHHHMENDPNALLTLPEILKEDPSIHGEANLAHARHVKGNRSRSMSEPLAWLLSHRSSSPSSGLKRQSSKRTSRPGSVAAVAPIAEENMDVSYVAEYHENLQHVLAFLTVSRQRAGFNIEANVVPGAYYSEPGHLILRCDTIISHPLSLPTHVETGPATVSVVGGQHYQIKLAAKPPADSPTTPDLPTPELLDASHLQTILPTTLICSSCSLPLVRGAQIKKYRDLPSEHWAELVDAWMCHSDQTLHEHVQKGSRDGFWPAEGEALVGGSYILLREDVIVKVNFCDVEPSQPGARIDDWIRIRCICGAVVGKCQLHKTPTESVMVYRLAKYAFRPVSPTAEPTRLPLSAFIVEDMCEFVHAHATYRFIILDEEQERPRILIWLFKPNMRLSYATPAQYVIPRSGSLRAAKVLFKVLAPSTMTAELSTILNKHPGFPQAEHLHYPLEVCRRLAALLKESNTAYPESMRTMTGLDVGWLQRA